MWYMYICISIQAYQLHEFGDQFVFAGGRNLGFSAQFSRNETLRFEKETNGMFI
jgi:hypothetical protein